MTLDVNGIGNGVIGSLLVVFIQYSVSKGTILVTDKYRRSKKKHPFSPFMVSISIYLLFLVLLVLFTFFRFSSNEGSLTEQDLLTQQLNSIVAPLICIISLSFAEIISLYRILRKYSRFGIVSLDKSAKQGLSYNKSILNTNYKLDFIGVGARKLTENDKDFSEMVERVNQQNNEVRLILSHPENESLMNLSTRADSNEGEYGTKVKNSLKLIARLKEEKKYNISVRFYRANSIPDMQVFRLMIIDENYCLVTYSQFNDSSHKGENLPQLHLKKTNNEEFDKSSLLNGFQKYFNQTWNYLVGEEWNYKDHI